jgi:homoserine dehydrogenase
VDGFDTAHKAAILASMAYGFHVPMDELLVEGIRNLSGDDVRYAAEFGYRIKLLAVINRRGDEVEVRVHPTLVPRGHMLASVNNVFNAVMVKGDLSDNTLYYGRGAGRDPTASTVIGDVGDIAKNIAAGGARYGRGINIANESRMTMLDSKKIRSRYYLRLMVADKAGSLGIMTNILGSYGVSILGANQKVHGCEDADADYVPVVMLTHEANEADMNQALKEIFEAGVVCEEPVKLRMI